MKYQNKIFMVPYMSKKYRNNWENTFGSKLAYGDVVVIEQEKCLYEIYDILETGAFVLRNIDDKGIKIVDANKVKKA